MRIDLDQINDVDSLSKFKGKWKADVSYKTDETVIYDNALYNAVIGNTGVIPLTDNTHTYWSLAFEQTPFVFQVGAGSVVPANGSPLQPHYHIAKMSISLARQLVDSTLASVDVVSEEVNGHQHTLTIVYDFAKHTFIATNVTTESGSSHAAWLIGGGGSVAQPDAAVVTYADLTNRVTTGTLVPNQTYRVTERPTTTLGMNGDILIKALSAKDLDNNAILVAKVPDYANTQMWSSIKSGDTYTYTRTDTTYTEILPQQNDVVALYSGDDNKYQQAIGFIFTYAGIEYTSCTVDNNGRIIFGAQSYEYGEGVLPVGTTLTIALMWYDLLSPNNNIQAFTTGTAPNRKFVLNFTDTQAYGSPQVTFTGHIILEETTNAIQLGILNASSGLLTAGRGIQYLNGSYNVNANASDPIGANQTVIYTPDPLSVVAGVAVYAINDGYTWVSTGATNVRPGLTLDWQKATLLPGADINGNTLSTYNAVKYTAIIDAVIERIDTNGNRVLGANPIQYFPWGKPGFKNNSIDADCSLNVSLQNGSNICYFSDNTFKKCNLASLVIPDNVYFVGNTLTNLDAGSYTPQQFQSNNITNSFDKNQAYYSSKVIVNNVVLPSVPNLATTYSTGIVKVGNGLDVDNSGLVSISSSTTIVYNINSLPSYQQLYIFSIFNGDYTTHDRIVITGYHSILYLKNIDYNILAYGASFGTTWLGDGSYGRKISIEGATFIGTFYVHESVNDFSIIGHNVTMTRCTFDNITVWQTSSGGFRDSHVFNNCIIGYVGRGAAYNNTPGHKLIINNSIIGQSRNYGYIFSNYDAGTCSLIVRDSTIILNAGVLVDQGVSVYPYITYTNCTVVRSDGTSYRLDNSGDALASNSIGFDIYDVSGNIRTSVVQGSYNESGEMSVDVTGSIAGMRFSYKLFDYEYFPGDAGTLVWHRNNKGGGSGSGGAALTAATASTLGGLIVGSRLSVDNTGIVSADSQVQNNLTSPSTTLAPSVDAVSAATAFFAPKESPALTGAPTAPTAPSDTNTTQLATTAFVQAAVATGLIEVTSAGSGKKRYYTDFISYFTGAYTAEQDVVRFGPGIFDNSGTNRIIASKSLSIILSPQTTWIVNELLPYPGIYVADITENKFSIDGSGTGKLTGNVLWYTDSYSATENREVHLSNLFHTGRILHQAVGGSVDLPIKLRLTNVNATCIGQVNYPNIATWGSYIMSAAYFRNTWRSLDLEINNCRFYVENGTLIDNCGLNDQGGGYPAYPFTRVIIRNSVVYLAETYAGVLSAGNMPAAMISIDSQNMRIKTISTTTIINTGSVGVVQNSLTPASTTLAPSVDAINTLIGSLTTLSTADKSSVVNAINSAAGVSVSAIRVLANRTRQFYTGIGTTANTASSDGLTLALADAQSGETVQQITNAAIGGLMGNSQQVLIKNGVIYDAGGFTVDATLGTGDGVTILGGTGKIFGRNAVVKTSGSGSWGIGWYGNAVAVNYSAYDLHFETNGAYCITTAAGKLYHTGSLTVTNGNAVLCRGTSPYEHVGKITVNDNANALTADRPNTSIINTGDVILTTTTSRAGGIAQTSTIELRNGVLDLRVSGASSGFTIDPTSTLILRDITVLGALPAMPSASGQAVGAMVYLYGYTTFPAGTFAPEIQVIDMRNPTGQSSYGVQTGSTIDFAYTTQERAAFAGTVTIDTFLNVKIGAKTRLRLTSLNNIYVNLSTTATTVQQSVSVTFPTALPNTVVQGSMLRIDSLLNIVSRIYSNTNIEVAYQLNTNKQGTAVVDLLTPDALLGALVFDSGSGTSTVNINMSASSIGAVSTPVIVQQSGYFFVPGTANDVFIEVLKTNPLTFGVEIIPNLR